MTDKAYDVVVPMMLLHRSGQLDLILHDTTDHSTPIIGW